ncbi:MAG: HDOD domain-containing protein [Planctomycetota bacterium]
MPRVLDILRNLRTAPPLPGVAMRVLQIVRDPEYSTTELVDTVRTDPSLTARVLRLCNSAMFSLPAPITSVAEATAFIGTNNLVKLVLVACAVNHFQRAGTSIYGSPTDLWRNTFALATTCQWLARRSGRLEANTGFTAGVLHNVGKVVLSQLPPDATYDQPPPDADHVAREALLFGIDHAAAAAVVADAWQLPREIGKALRTHHAADGTADSPLSACLDLAETTVLQAGIGNAFPGAPLTVQPASLACLGLAAADLESARAHMMGELARNEELLNLGSA